MKSISPEELHAMISGKQDFQLIDVRESYEYEDQNIGGINIPLDELLDRRAEIQTDKKVIICCEGGKRSAAMTHTLKRKYDMDIFSLEGGLNSYFEKYT